MTPLPAFALAALFLPAVFKRSESGHLLEETREMGWCAQSALPAHIKRRHVRMRKHLLGLLESVVAQEFAGRHVRLPLEQVEEHGARIAYVVDKAVHMDARGIVALQPFDGFVE